MPRGSRGVWALGFVLASCGGERAPVFRAVSDAGMAMPDRGDPVDVGSAVTGCRADRDCDDRLECTDDTCVIGGVCEHAPVSSRCPAGQRCFPAQGCATMEMRRCSADAQCDDGVACTRDVCLTGGTCSSIRDDARCAAGQVCAATGCLAMGRCVGDAECDNGTFCDGDERCVGGTCQPGARRGCSDGDPCTGDVCNEALRRCDNPPLNPCGGTVLPGMYRLTPALQYNCGSGGLGPVQALTLGVSASGIELTGLPTPLRGPPPSMGMFAANGTENRGTCQWAYTLNGAFTMPDRFNGALSITFNFCEASLRCLSQTFAVTGVRQ